MSKLMVLKRKRTFASGARVLMKKVTVSSALDLATGPTTSNHASFTKKEKIIKL